MTTPTRINQDIAPRPPRKAPSAPPVGSPHRRGASLAVVVAGSLATGLLAAAALAAAPFVPATESALTGAVLSGFAIGWAVLAGFSARFAARSQQWALVPAVAFGASGLALLALGSSAHPAIDWVWPPAMVGLALWMAGRVRRGAASRAARWMLYPVIGVTGLAGIGGAYQIVGTVTAPSSSMPGRLVDVGGHRLHLSCTGSGSPTVVLEAGGGAMAAQLAHITPAVARASMICVYDRAGRGWSEPADSPQDALAISTDLHTLLQRAGVPGPYVMAGHSFGGLYALTFAANHPDEVAGMALIDSTSPDYSNPVGSAVRPATSRSDDVVGRTAALTSSVARLGLGRLFAALASSDLPSYERAQVRATSATPAALRSIIEEYGRASASTDEAASLRDLGNRPLMVLSASVGNAPDWLQKQERLASLSTDTVHRVVDGASHASLVSEEAYAATSSQAILEVVSAVRTGQPLSR